MKDKIWRPEPDSQFRLRPCRCGSDDVVYKSSNTLGAVSHAVKCLACGTMTTWYLCKHDAQIMWNKRVAIIGTRNNHEHIA